MKVYLPSYPSGAGHWIYKGYAAAWALAGYQIDLLCERTMKEAVESNQPYMAMMVEGSLPTLAFPDAAKRFMDKAKAIFMYVNPNTFPHPWGTHPNFVSTLKSSLIRNISERENVHLWNFSKTEGTNPDFFSEWKVWRPKGMMKIHHVPLAFDSAGYNSEFSITCFGQETPSFDVVFIGGVANNGFNEKLHLMLDAKKALEDLNINLGFYIGSNVTHQFEVEALSRAKITLNIHDAYQRELGRDTNERTFKSLGLNGFMISDRIECLDDFDLQIPQFTTTEELKSLVSYYLFNRKVQKKLSKIRAENQKEIEENHTYLNRVEQFLQIINV